MILNTFPVENRRFFENLRGRDRSNLTDVLCLMRDNGIKGVNVTGSSLFQKMGKKGEYDDIDLYVIGISPRHLLNFVQELQRKGAFIERVSAQKKILYMGTTLDDRYELTYNGTKFDIGQTNGGMVSSVLEKNLPYNPLSY